MKKTIALCLSAVLSASMIFCSCGKQGQGTSAPAETTGAEVVETTAGTTGAEAAETTAGSTESTGTSETAAGTAEEKVIDAPQIKAADFPVTDGSTATLPLAWMLYRLCTGEDQAAAEKAMGFTKTNNAYIRLMDKEADLVIAYEPGPNAQEDPRFKDLELKPIGLDALVFLTLRIRCSP